MADPHGTAKGIDHQQRLKEHETRASELCSMALEQADELYERGDLTPYLTVLTRLHFFNFYNLLLILRQFPSATHLGSFLNWQKQMKLREPDKKWVLKRDQVGKGIELVAPFTNRHPEGTLSLSWYSHLQFDVSQTNISRYEAPRSVYVPGSNHIPDLLRALRSMLSEEYGAVVLTDPGSRIYNTGIPGYIEDKTVHCNPKNSVPVLLTWLTESLLTLSHPEQVIGERYQRLFLQMAQHCLFQIWGVEDRRMQYLPQNADLIRSIPMDLRPVFLDLLQRRVRHIEETIYSKYQEQLYDREEEATTNALPALPLFNGKKEAVEQ